MTDWRRVLDSGHTLATAIHGRGTVRSESCLIRRSASRYERGRLEREQCRGMES